MGWKGGINFSSLSGTRIVDSRHTSEIGVHQEVGRKKNGVELLQCYPPTDPLPLSLSPLSLSLATRQKRREPRKLNSVSRVTFTVNERIFFFSLSPSLSLPYFYTKRNKRAIRGSFDSSIILTSPFGALDPLPLPLPRPPPCHTDRRSIQTNRRFGATFEILKNESVHGRGIRGSEECIG